MDLVVMWVGLAIAIFAYMSLWFGLAWRLGRYDVVDSAWGLGFIYIAWLAVAIHNQVTWPQVVSASLASVWGLRLFVHISRRNLGKPEDKRYTELRARWGRRQGLRAYTNVFLLQGLLILLVSTPVVATAQTNHAWNAVTIIGWVVWGSGIMFEALADWQLARFLRQRPAGSHSIMQTGLWHYSRHPNYFGEVTTWWGAAIVACSFGQWWGIIGAIVITVLITKISGIPPLEKHYAGNSEYEAYKRCTPVLVPWLPRS